MSRKPSPAQLLFQRGRILSHEELLHYWTTRKKVFVNESGCWIWQGGRNNTGYGQASFNGIRQLAHRMAYKFTVGPIPQNICICHKCDVRLCVNPAHLFAGTQQDNIKDQYEKGRYVQRRVCAGEKNPNAKFSEADVRAIRALAASGRTQRQIAKLYGVRDLVVHRIVHRITWAHVPDIEPICTVWGIF